MARNVANVGDGVMVGIAVALAWCVPNAAEYVLVARPEATISPAGAGTEVLNTYVGMVKVGVGSGKFGRVVATVSVSEEKKDKTWSKDSAGAVALFRG